MKLQVRYSTIVSTLALVVALTGITAQAAGVFVTSKQIKNGTILTQDIHKNAVKSADLGTGAVTSTDLKTGAVQTADIGAGQVQPEDVTMPAPSQLQEPDTATLQATGDFTLVDVAGSYTKQDPSSILQVDWTGSATAGTLACVFQLRVDGQASAGAGGVVFVNGNQSVAASALFEGLPAGAHQIEVWARAVGFGGPTSPCTVGPAFMGISQTFVVSEQVV